MQACGSIHRVLWSQHCLRRDIILLGGINEQWQNCVFYMRCRLQVTYNIQNYMKVFSNFANTLLKQQQHVQSHGYFLYLFCGLH